MNTSDAAQLTDRQWHIVGRWQEYEGERRANLLRLGAVAAFYVVQLLNFYVFDRGAEDGVLFHRAATALAVACTLLALGVMLCLRNRVFPASLKFLSTACDIFLLTALAAVSQAQANSPLVFVYFVVLLMAGLRFSLQLVWFATLGCMAAYLALVGLSDDVWFDEQHTVRPVQQLVVHLSLALSGIVLGQMVRCVKSVAADYAQRVENTGAPP